MLMLLHPSRRLLAGLLVIAGSLLLAGSASHAQDPDLSAALLMPADLPGEWTMLARPDREGTRPCGMELGFTPRALDRAEVLFEASPTGPFLQHVVGRYAPDVAAALMDEFRAALVTCPAWEATTDDGRTVHSRWEPLALAPLGDDTVAAYIVIESGNLFGRTHAIAVRRGDLVMLLVHTAAGLAMPADPDRQLTEALLQLADARLAALLTGAS